MNTTTKIRSAMFKEAWFNSKIGNLVLVDRATGKVQEFSLTESYTDKRFKYEMTEQDKIDNVKVHGENYDTELDPEDSWGANGWNRMRRLEEADN